MLCDYHTHAVHPGRLELLSGFDPQQDTYVSLELHPWQGLTAIPAGFAARLPQFCALGEVGFDRYRGAPLPRQLELFDQLLQLATDCRKPVVIHAVGSCELLFQAVKSYNLKLMYHGFARHSAPLLERLWRAGFWISLNRRLLDDPEIMRTVQALHGRRIGWESDAEEFDLEKLWHDGARRTGLPDWLTTASNDLREFLGEI